MATGSISKQYLFKEYTGVVTVSGSGWEAFSISNTSVSGYKIVGAVSFLCNSGAPLIYSLYCNTFASPPNMLINSKSSGSVSYRVTLMYEKN